MRRHSPWAVLSVGAMVLAGLGVLGEFRSEPGGDAAALLYAAGRILDGTKLYSGLVDLNPPFTFLFHIPFIVVARLTGLNPVASFRIGLLLVIALSLVTTLLVLSRSSLGSAARHALAAALLLCACGIAIAFFGEREHLQIVLMFPYLCFATSRALGDRLPGWLAVLAGTLGGLGLALKVTAWMVPVLIALLLWLTARRRSDESLWTLVALACFTGLGLIWAPGYLGEVRQLGGFYRGFSGAPMLSLPFKGVMAWPSLVAMSLALFGWPLMKQRPAIGVWLVAMLGFTISVMAQGKGFLYHYYPGFACAVTVTLLIITLPSARPGWLDALRRASAGAALIAMCAASVTVTAWRALGTAGRTSPLGKEVSQLLAGVPRGTTIAMESSRLGDGFPIALEQDYRLIGRFPHLWFMYPYDSAAVRLPEGVRSYHDSILTPLERSLRQQVAEDFANAMPSLLAIRNMGGTQGTQRYLCDDSIFRQAARRYHLVRRVGAMQLYQRDTTMHSEGACGSL